MSLELSTRPGLKLKGTSEQHARLLKAVQQTTKTFHRFTEPFLVDDLEFTVSWRYGQRYAEIIKIEEKGEKPRTETGKLLIPTEYSTVPEIKDYLDSKGIAYKSREKKADLLAKIK